MCGDTFEAGWSDEEAKKEFEKNFGEKVEDNDTCIVCDDCYKILMARKIYFQNKN